MALISLENVCLTFSVRQQKRVPLKDFLLKGMFLSSVNPPMQVHAMQDMTFRVDEGERLAIVGHNGAGKVRS